MNSVASRVARARAWSHAIPLAALLALAWLLPGKAMAANDCWIGSSPVAFGTVGQGGGTTSSSVTFTCNNDSDTVRSYRLCLYVDPSAGGNVAPRRLVHDWPKDYLAYDLYADSAMTRLIGSTTSGHAVYSIPFTISSRGPASGSMPVHGRIPAGQNVSAGAYYEYVTEVFRWVSQDGPTAPQATQCSASSQTTNSMPVTAMFADSCTVSATDMDFGSVASLAANRDQTSTISVRCPTGTKYQIALDYGVNSTGGGRRGMRGPGSSYLDYELYRDPARTRVWGERKANDESDRGDNTLQQFTVYGRVPAQATGSAGAYADTVTVTLTY